MLQDLPDTLFKNRPDFEKVLKTASAKHQLKLDASLKKAILNALSECDETADICLDKKGNPEPDPNLRDTENVPLSESVESFFEREVKPHVPSAWIDESKRDAQDGKVGIVGYEINFNRYFYTYEPPRPLPEIEADLQKLEHEIMEMLREMKI
jgi:type I restriction enzyme M protein